MECYAYVMYESENVPGSTGEVVCFADSVKEMSERMKVSRSWIYELLSEKTNNKKHTCNRYEVKKVYLN